MGINLDYPNCGRFCQNLENGVYGLKKLLGAILACLDRGRPIARGVKGSLLGIVGVP